MTRCPFSLSRLVKVIETGQVVYKAEKPGVPADGSSFRSEQNSTLVRQHVPPTAARRDHCRAFPDPQGNELARGPKRNFRILDPLDFLAEFAQHIPPKGSHTIRYYGWYSNKARGMRRKAAEVARYTSCSSEPPC